MPELDLMCLLAPKGLDCAMSMVAVVDKAKLHVLASSDPTITAGESFPRAQAYARKLSGTAIRSWLAMYSRRALSTMSIFRKMGINF